MIFMYSPSHEGAVADDHAPSDWHVLTNELPPVDRVYPVLHVYVAVLSSVVPPNWIWPLTSSCGGNPQSTAILMKDMTICDDGVNNNPYVCRMEQCWTILHWPSKLLLRILLVSHRASIRRYMSMLQYS